MTTRNTPLSTLAFTQHKKNSVALSRKVKTCKIEQETFLGENVCIAHVFCVRAQAGVSWILWPVARPFSKGRFRETGCNYFTAWVKIQIWKI